MWHQWLNFNFVKLREYVCAQRKKLLLYSIILLPKVTALHHFKEYHNAYTRFPLHVNNTDYADCIHERAPPERKQHWLCRLHSWACPPPERKQHWLRRLRSICNPYKAFQSLKSAAHSKSFSIHLKLYSKFKRMIQTTLQFKWCIIHWIIHVALTIILKF